MRMTIPRMTMLVFMSVMFISMVYTLSGKIENRGITESISDLYIKSATVNKPIAIVKSNISATPSHKNHLVRFVAGHWRLPINKASIIVKAAFKYGKEYKVPPLFVLSEIATESSFRTKAYSDRSAVGIMQVYPKEHWAYVVKHGYIGNHYKQLFGVVPNIKFGTYILSRYYHVYGSVNKAAAHYFGICSFDKTYVRRIDTNLSLLESKA